jgi:GAF domain-containing protein
LLAALAERDRELAEARRREEATAHVLEVINSSPGSRLAAFDAIVENAMQLCAADCGGLWVVDGDVVTVHSPREVPKPYLEYLTRETAPLMQIFGPAVEDCPFLHIEDLAATEAYRNRISATVATVDLGGVRTCLGVPLRQGSSIVGILNLFRQTVRPFSDGEISSAQGLARQAQIAMHNARLFDEVRGRTHDLTVALQQQTATADILQAMANSPSDAQPVFDAVADRAMRLLKSWSVVVTRYDGEQLHFGAARGALPDTEAYVRQTFPVRPDPDGFYGRCIREKRPINDPDRQSLPGPDGGEYARRRGFHAALVVPMQVEDRVLGLITVTRAMIGAFADEDVRLLRTFADQAAMAINNVTLFNETQEALQQQSATADVLKVISRSVFDLDTVLQTLIDTAVRLARGSRGTIFIKQGEVLVARAFHRNVPDSIRAYLETTTWRIDGSSHMARAVREGNVVHIPDLSQSEIESDEETRKRAAFGAGLWAPLMRDGQAIGVFGVPRDEPIAFTNREIELVQTFSDQAVIAIENVRLFDEVEARTRDLTESLQQQTATADVLKVISRSAFDLQTVLDTLVRSAVELSGSSHGLIYLHDGDAFRLAAHSSMNPDFVRYLKQNPQRSGRGSGGARVLLTGVVQNIPDIQADEEYDPGLRRASGRRTRALLAVPLMRDQAIAGAIILTRPKPGAFTQRQIELVQTFADQAVIAIENVRLFDEVQARTRDLSEALEQQTATADVLKAISRAAFDLDTVLNTLISTAVRLCNARHGQIFRRHGDRYRYAASQMDVDPAYRQHEERVEISPGRGTLIGRVAEENRTVSIADAWADPEYAEKDQARLGNVRAMLGVPLMRSGEPIGAFALARSEPVPFTQRQIELVTTFADQAVIAIENVRLFDEVQARTRDLTEALQQQTATADVLKVISRSAFNLQVVLDTLAESAYRLCGAGYGLIYLRSGDDFECKAIGGVGAEEGAVVFKGRPIHAGRGTAAERVISTGEIQIIPDMFDDPEFDPRVKEAIQGAATPTFASLRSLCAVPMKRDHAVVGVIVIARTQTGALPIRQIELLQTFADQAVIAIENARLFDEVQARTKDLQESLLQQTATADVLKVISRSAFDLQAVFDTLVSTAVELTDAYTGTICVRDGDVYRYRAFRGVETSVQLDDYLRQNPAKAGRGSIAGRTILSGRVEQIADILEDEEYVVPMTSFGNPSRALIGVPLLGKDRVEGALILTRRDPGAYTPRQIEILQTFADQAVIAIENVRLFDEVQARTRELATSLDDLRRTQDRLIQSEKLASLGQLTAGIAHEIKNPLNFVNNFSALSRELIDELGQLLEKAPLEKDQREEAGELLGMVGSNLDKVVQHGKRADSIVKNMLLHSREGSGERSRVNVNTMVEEALNLAYHGARAEKPGFNVTIVRSLDPEAGAADLYAQEMTRVLLNLISNGFYATTKRKQGESNDAYEPTVTASTRDLGDRVEIAIRDNGTGIPEGVKAKMFNPFFTTKPAGEGTGLGLSLSHDIVVKQHGGSIEVSTESGSYSQFTIVLPREAGARDEK